MKGNLRTSAGCAVSTTPTITRRVFSPARTWSPSSSRLIGCGGFPTAPDGTKTRRGTAAYGAARSSITSVTGTAQSFYRYSHPSALVSTRPLSTDCVGPEAPRKFCVPTPTILGYASRATLRRGRPNSSPCKHCVAVQVGRHREPSQTLSLRH